ncbi:MAG TPA: kelch repeat-containing protein [Kofleriaceae bacterium]
MRWLLAVALVGCIDSDLVECPDGLLCPRGTACDVAHRSCVAPDQLTACEGLAELTSCQATGVEMGRCFDGVCLPAGCGNGFTEPGERCDDANTRSGDGCSADCVSREICGDGFADATRGEQCDDGNTRGRDGCTNGCTRELPLWRSHLAPVPTPRFDAAAAYDPLAASILVFGGVDTTGMTVAETWALNEFGWSALFTGVPVRRSTPAIAYDPAHHRVVMFGGFSGSAQGVLLNDTWEWNGATWVRRTSTVVPAARTNAGMAWDGSRLILFGGSQLNVRLADTWAWDGTAWTRLTPAAAPSPREGHAMVFDAKYNRLVLFGGRSPTALNDTWLFDGTSWTELPGIGVPPSTMKWAGLAYDAKREVVVLSGVAAGTQNNEVWELNGAQWTQKPAGTTPAISGGAAIAYDERSQLVVQYSGEMINGEISNEVWDWDGVSWRRRVAPQLPSVRSVCALASDPARGRVVLFGGQGPTVPLGDTWEWDGRGWKRYPGSSPPLRAGSALAYDGGEVVLFGGAGATIYGDTWRFDGARWLSVSSTGPSPRYGHGMTYDRTRNRVVLFGGADGTGVFNDTWLWDGTLWTQLQTVGAPARRVFTKLAYDIKRDRVVLYGGLAEDGTTQLPDTWELEGNNWTERTSPVMPEERLGYSLVYDRMRERVMLFGGLVSSFSLWEWDGTEWTQPEVMLTPLLTVNACSTYDDARGEIVSFGGEQFTLQQTTSTGSYRGDRDEVCRAGIDLDGDTYAGCADDDCRMVCAPLCWDDPACTTAPRCGDGTCSTLEAAAGAACTDDCP